MSFKEENIAGFEALFEQSKNSIREFPGCRYVELLRDRKEPGCYFTYSHWDSEADLERYRQSDFFKKVWSRTREMLNSAAEAWSCDRLKTVD